MRSLPTRPHPSRRGSVLIIALIVLFALAGLVLAMSRAAQTDSALAANLRATHQADSIARGAEQYVVALLTDYKDSLTTLTEADFAQVPVGDGFFWISRPTYNDPSLTAYGLTDESTKLNLNVATLETLQELEGMTDQVAAAIVDWRDENDTPESNGAESPDYMGLVDAYRAKNAPFEAVEELLLLKGMTRELYYGSGATGQAAQAFERNYYQTNGLHEFFTCWSTTPATAADGTQRVRFGPTNVEQRDALRNLLRDKLSETRANEIVGTGPGSFGLLGQAGVVDIFEFARRVNLTTDEFESIEDYLTAATGNNAPRGLVNINTAPREVLVALVPRVMNVPGAVLAEADIDTLLARRSNNAPTDTPSMAWVWDVLKERAVGLGQVITARGEKYSADIVAVGRGGRAFKHVRIVVDAAQSPARIIYRRDLTDQGWPLDQQILDSVRAAAGQTSPAFGSGGGGAR